MGVGGGGFDEEGAKEGFRWAGARVSGARYIEKVVSLISIGTGLVGWGWEWLIALNRIHRDWVVSYKRLMFPDWVGGQVSSQVTWRTFQEGGVCDDDIMMNRMNGDDYQGSKKKRKRRLLYKKNGREPLWEHV